MTSLFLLFADAALASANPPSQAGNDSGDIVVAAPAQRGTRWSPRVDDWHDDTPTCPYFFDEEIRGFGTLRVGPRCTDGGQDSLAPGLPEMKQ
jgi:hypothetical protein